MLEHKIQVFIILRSLMFTKPAYHAKLCAFRWNVTVNSKYKRADQSFIHQLLHN